MSVLKSLLTITLPCIAIFLTLIYLGNTFYYANFNWLADLKSWTFNKRGMFVFWTLCGMAVCLGVGFIYSESEEK